jgi:hypothetical protein
MIELKSYLSDILRALDKNYDVEDVKFEATDDGYRIIFKAEADDEEVGVRGQWYRNNELIVKLGEKFFEKWDLEPLGVKCVCDGCSCANEKKT